MTSVKSDNTILTFPRGSVRTVDLEAMGGDVDGAKGIAQLSSHSLLPLFTGAEKR
jgi:hypothetical protein